ncbi:hypothetical protein ACO0SA_004597 [Hanseniaspora valbyensis]
MKLSSTNIVLFIFALFACLSECASNKKLLKETKRGYRNVIKLTDSNFKSILKPTRDSYVVVFLTATQEDIGCTLCQAMEPEYYTLAESWFRTHPDGLNDPKETGEKGLFFARADYSEAGNSQVFQHFKAAQVPLMYVFGPSDDPTGDINTFQQLNIPASTPAGDQRIEVLINSFVHHFGLKDYAIYKPVDYVSKAITASAVLLVVFLLKKFNNFVTKIVKSRILWAVISTAFIIIMCNGYMFNKIRNSPYAGNGKNGVEYFQGGMQNQFAIETQIVSFLYASLGLAVLFLVKLVPYLNQYYLKQKKQYNAATSSLLLTVILLAVVFFFSSALMFVFRIKYPGYPFKFLK